MDTKIFHIQDSFAASNMSCYDKMEAILEEFPKSKTISITFLPCLSCLLNHHEKEEIYIQNKILRDTSLLVRQQRNNYHQIIHQNDVQNRFLVYHLETSQIDMIKLLADMVGEEDGRYGNYVSGLCSDILKNR